MATWTKLGTVKQQLREAGIKVLIKDIKHADIVWQSDFKGFYHTVIKHITMRDGSIYRLVMITVDKDGLFSIDSGVMQFSASLLSKGGVQ